MTRRLLTDRTDIARTINFRKMPIIKIDLADRRVMFDNDGYIVSQPVLIDAGYFDSGEPYYLRADIRAYSDEPYFRFHQGGICLKNSFTYEDMKEILDYANAPIVKADEDILVCVVDSEKRDVYSPMIMHTAKRIDKYCSVPLEFEDYVVNADARVFLRSAGLDAYDRQAKFEEA